MAIFVSLNWKKKKWHRRIDITFSHSIANEQSRWHGFGSHLFIFTLYSICTQLNAMATQSCRNCTEQCSDWAFCCCFCFHSVKNTHQKCKCLFASAFHLDAITLDYIFNNFWDNFISTGPAHSLQFSNELENFAHRNPKKWKKNDKCKTWNWRAKIANGKNPQP